MAGPHLTPELLPPEQQGKLNPFFTGPNYSSQGTEPFKHVLTFLGDLYSLIQLFKHYHLRIGSLPFDQRNKISRNRQCHHFWNTMGHFLRSKPYLLASFTHSTNMYYASGTILGTGDASLNDRVKNSYPREAYDVMGGGRHYDCDE